MKSIIEIENLEKRFGKVEAVRGLSLRIPEGKVTAFLGPNGGGKTTLLKILSTLIPVTRGRACVLGYNLAHESHAVRKHLGVVFQHPSLDPKLTVMENLRHHGHLPVVHPVSGVGFQGGRHPRR